MLWQNELLYINPNLVCTALNNGFQAVQNTHMCGHVNGCPLVQQHPCNICVPVARRHIQGCGSILLRTHDQFEGVGW